MKTEIFWNLAKKSVIINMAEQEAPPAPPAGDGGDVVEVPKKNQTPKEPPVTFRDFDVSQD